MSCLTYEPAPPSEPLQKPRVLVVEDDARLARGIGRLLRRYAVSAVTNARGALELMKAPAAPFDAILCDLRLPEMSGIEFYECVRSSFPGNERRIVFMTGGPTSPETAHFVGTVPNPVLEKPFSFETLQSAIASRLAVR